MAPPANPPPPPSGSSQTNRFAGLPASTPAPASAVTQDIVDATINLTVADSSQDQFASQEDKIFFEHTTNGKSTTDVLPDWFLATLNQRRNPPQYPSLMAPRGSDRPKLFAYVDKDGKEKKGGRYQADNFADVAVVVHTNDNKILDFGDLFAESKRQFIKMDWHTETQYGEFSLRVTRSNGDQVTMKVFATGLKRDFNNSSKPVLEMNCGKDVKRIPKDCKALQHANALNGVTEVYFEVFASNEEAPAWAPPYDMAVFRGISSEDQEILYSKLEAKEELDIPDTLIAQLMTAQRFTVYRLWKDDVIGHWQEFARYITGAFSMCAQFGNLWFFAMQTDIKIWSTDFPHDDVEPPTCLAQKWEIRRNDNGKIVGYKMLRWAALHKTDIYPNSVVGSFVHRHCAARARYVTWHAINESLASQAMKIRATFMIPAHAEREGIFMANLFMQIASSKGEGQLRPALKTRVVLRVGKKTWNGTVTDDIFGSKAQLVVACSGTPTEAMLKSEQLVSLELQNDPTPITRMLAGLCEIGEGVKRTEGPNLGELFFEAPRTSKKPGEWISKHFGSLLAEDVKQICKEKFTFDNEQLSYAEGVITTKTGSNFLWGPPGTGKSTSLMGTLATLLGCVPPKPENRWPFLVVAPSNDAVDGDMEKFIELSERKLGRKFEIIRFTGAFTNKKMLSEYSLAGDAPGKTQEQRALEMPEMQSIPDTLFNEAGEEVINYDDDEVADADKMDTAAEGSDPKDVTEESVEDPGNKVWNLLDGNTKGTGMFPELAYHARLFHYIHLWASPGHKTSRAHENAKKFLSLKEQLASGAIPKKERKAKEVEKDNLQTTLSDHYLMTVCDGVFTTYVASAHPVLRSGFFAVIVAMDELAQPSIAEAAIPTGSQKESVKLVLGAGDWEQQGVIPQGKGFNECYNVAEQSLLKQVYDLRPEQVTQLLVQYRMHPDISAPVNYIWYDGKLIDAAHLANVHFVGAAIKDVMHSTFGPAYNGKYAVAIDSHSENSMNFENTMTQCNYGEAKVVVHMIALFLDRNKDVGPEHIGVITPYTGQERLIRRMLLEKGIWHANAKQRITVSTAAQVQGVERRVIFLSLCVNHPDQPLQLGFVKTPQQLCVELSRAQSFLFVVGNFHNWVAALVKPTEALVKSRGGLRVFGKIMEHYHETNSIISADDYADGMAGKTPKTAQFPKLFKSKTTYGTIVPKPVVQGKIFGKFEARQAKAEDDRRKESWRKRNNDDDDDDEDDGAGDDKSTDPSKKKSRRNNKKKKTAPAAASGSSVAGTPATTSAPVNQIAPENLSRHEAELNEENARKDKGKGKDKV